MTSFSYRHIFTWVDDEVMVATASGHSQPEQLWFPSSKLLQKDIVYLSGLCHYSTIETN